MTADASKALMRAGLSRRSFLKRSGVLIVSFSATGSSATPGGPAPVPGGEEAQRRDVEAGRVDSWLAVTADGDVKAYTGKCELGQGMYTAQVQLVAEELDVSVGRVELVQCETPLTPDQGTTSGSQSHPANFNDENLAQAAATARQALLRLAAERLGAPVDQLTAADG